MFLLEDYFLRIFNEIYLLDFTGKLIIINKL